MHIVQDIDGVTMARAQAGPDLLKLQLSAPSGFTEDGGFFPAESLSIEGREGIAALYELLEGMLAAFDEENDDGKD